MPITVISTATQRHDSYVNLVPFARPGGAQTGDLLVIAFRNQAETGIAIEIPGFTRVTPNPSGTGRGTAFLTRVIVSIESEPENYPLTGITMTGRYAITLLLIRGGRAINPVGDHSKSYSGTVSGMNVTVEALSSQAAGSMQIVMGAGEFTAGNSHVPNVLPAGFTEIAQVPDVSAETGASRTSQWIGSKIVPAGSTPEITIGWDTVAGPAAQSIMISPLGAADRLATPAVTILGKTEPTSETAKDGSVTVAWEPVPGAVRYSAHKASKMAPSQTDFTQVASDVSSPHTVTGLGVGPVAVGIRAEVA